MFKIEKGMFMSLISDRGVFDMIIDFNIETNIIKTRKGGSYTYDDVVLYKEVYYEDFSTEEDYDIIISNPPFSQKDNVLKRLFELDKPYAMLLPIPSLQGQTRFEYMKDGLQYLGFDKRINYYMNSDFSQVQKGVSFGSCYLCKKFLPSDLILEELKTKN